MCSYVDTGRAGEPAIVVGIRWRIFLPRYGDVCRYNTRGEEMGLMGCVR